MYLWSRLAVPSLVCDREPEQATQRLAATSSSRRQCTCICRGELFLLTNMSLSGKDHHRSFEMANLNIKLTAFVGWIVTVLLIQQQWQHPCNGPLSGTTWMSWYQKGKNQSGFYWSKSHWVAVASAGPYTNLHLAIDRQPCQHPTTLFFAGWMPFLPPSQQHRSTGGTLSCW